MIFLFILASLTFTFRLCHELSDTLCMHKLLVTRFVNNGLVIQMLIKEFLRIREKQWTNSVDTDQEICFRFIVSIGCRQAARERIMLNDARSYSPLLWNFKFQMNFKHILWNVSTEFIPLLCILNRLFLLYLYN